MIRFTISRSTILEGLRSMVRHPLVTLASITTITLMLLLLSSFLAFSNNARRIAGEIGQQPPVEITMEIGVSDLELLAVADALSNDESVVEMIAYTPQENFEMFKQNMEDEGLFDDFPFESSIPYTFTVRLADPGEGESFQSRLSAFPGVRKVSLEQQVMVFLKRAITWVNWISFVILFILGVIAFFIISNMVRVAVFARGEEISIMKYVGATNWYIRVPFIIEGALVGLIGALLATGVVALVYNRVYNSIMTGIRATDYISLEPLRELVVPVLLINLLVGIGVGSLGSAVSVRRHIRV